jgi:uncharacterized protein (TIGR02594 family)
MLLRVTGMLIGLTATLATSASAGTLNKAPKFSESLRHSGGHFEFTDMSARRRHSAVRHQRTVRHHARYDRVSRYRVSRAAAPMMMQGYADQHGIAAYSVTANSYSAANSYASARHAGGVSDFGGTGVVAEARRYIGTNPTGRSSLWCANFMNMVLERSGHRGSGSNLARSFASYGTRISGPQVGAIAVMSRGKRGGHVGVVSGIDPNGNPIVISGNHGRRVAESTYSRGRIYAYVMP